jgi:glycogen phosphorylase
MHPIHIFNVVPKLPAALEPLRELALNLWWTWEPSARALFHHLDPTLWHETNHNPLRMLQRSRQARLEEIAGDDDFIREMEGVITKFRAYLAAKDTWWGTKTKKGLTAPVAYFSAEFGLHESFPNYSGGLGILSGDHCKSASDLGIPFVAIGLLYKHGYFKQQIGKDGWQESHELNQNFSHLAVQPVNDKDGNPLSITVKLLGRSVRANVWRIAVGRISLYLMDTDVPENVQEDREITAQLYGGDHEMRIRQEILLGIGGVHALNALGIKPAAFHLNEGHAAFISLELIRRRVQEDGLDFYSALQATAAANVFTTHTPVPAGNDAFALDLMRKHFGDYPASVGIDFEEFASFGQTRKDPHEPFSMTILALRTSRHANGVSRLHGYVSQRIWEDVWAGVPRDEVPITSVTNGIHTKTWVAAEFSTLYDRYLPGWEAKLTDRDFWRKVQDIPDDVLWETHQKQKRRTIAFIRERVRLQRQRLGESPEKVRAVSGMLNPEVLTIGFARRFATYKRATLLFADPARLHKLMNSAERPVQFVFAGKAHPKDEPGKRFIQDVYKFTRMPEFEGRIVFIEDYDHYVGRRLYQGVDLWLNNPRRPLEASGTSGMKLPPSGGLNFSVLDGWWCEAHTGKNGWAIGAEIPESPEAPDAKFEDEVDIASLFHVLETQILPLYYAKPDGLLPLAWINLMRESIRTIVPVFNTHRMVSEYTERLYEPAAAAYGVLSADKCKKSVELSQWKANIRRDWAHVSVGEVATHAGNGLNIAVGDKLEVSARVVLGPIAPEFVCVQAYFGESANGRIAQPTTVELKQTEKLSGGAYRYVGAIPAMESGTYGLSVRVLPTHPNLIQAHELRLITWAK